MNKKAQLAMSTIIVILVIFGMVLAAQHMNFKQKGEIGRKQILVLKSYDEGEKARDFLLTASRISAYEALSSFETCPPESSDRAEFESNYKKYSTARIEEYISNTGVTVPRPNVDGPPDPSQWDVTSFYYGYNYIQITFLPASGYDFVFWPREIRTGSREYPFVSTFESGFWHNIQCSEYEEFRGG